MSHFRSVYKFKFKVYDQSQQIQHGMYHCYIPVWCPLLFQMDFLSASVNMTSLPVYVNTESNLLKPYLSKSQTIILKGTWKRIKQVGCNYKTRNRYIKWLLVLESFGRVYGMIELGVLRGIGRLSRRCMCIGSGGGDSCQPKECLVDSYLMCIATFTPPKAYSDNWCPGADWPYDLPGFFAHWDTLTFSKSDRRVAQESLTQWKVYSVKMGTH